MRRPLKALNRSAFFGFLPLGLTLSLALSACAPKDEHLGGKNGSGGTSRDRSTQQGGSGAVRGLPLVERKAELSRHLVLQLGQARLFMEKALNVKVKTRPDLAIGDSTDLSSSGCVSLVKLAPSPVSTIPTDVEKFTISYKRCADGPTGESNEVRGVLFGDENFQIKYSEPYPNQDSEKQVPGFPVVIDASVEVLDLTVGLPFVLRDKVVVDRENQAVVSRSAFFRATKIAEDATTLTYSAVAQFSDFYLLTSASKGSGTMVSNFSGIVFKVAKNDERRVLEVLPGSMSISVKGWTTDPRIKNRDNNAGRFSTRIELMANQVLALGSDFCAIPSLQMTGKSLSGYANKNQSDVSVSVADGQLEYATEGGKENREISLCQDVSQPFFAKDFGQLFF